MPKSGPGLKPPARRGKIARMNPAIESNLPLPNPPPRRVSVAPMMNWTDRHCRHFLRQISRHTWLYTEMVTTGAILRGDTRRFLRFDAPEHPVALQLGGSEPADLAASARIGEDFGYDEINLNVGCPSDRVQSGRFGACLMAEPQLVADCVAAMRAAVRIPVTVKTRIGIDDRDSYEHLHDFVSRVADAGCETLIVHARKAWLKGLSPKENREVPPLRYEVVAQLKRDFPQLDVIINGGIKTLEVMEQQLAVLDGVMIGREAYSNPYLLADVDRRFFGATTPVPAREAIVATQREYIARELAAGTPLGSITRHMLGLFQGQPGARRWRRVLSERAPQRGAGLEVLDAALRELAAAA